MPEAIRIDVNVPMEMRDGTVLRADVYRPEGRARYPAILIRTPYNKDWFNQSLFDPVAFARSGYAVVIQDIRGRYASEGEWKRTRMFEVEGADGFDTVECIARERWCDGRVGLGGGSYLTAMQWITAMENPPHLKAFAPYVGDIATHIAPPPETGAVSFYSAANALPITAMDLVNRAEARGEEVGELRRMLERAIKEPDWVLRFLPLKKHPLAQWEPIREMLEQRLTPVSQEELNRRRKYEKISVPGLHIGGWFDQLEPAVFANYRRMKERGGTPYAREHQHILVGPWDHGNPRGFLGDLEFGPAAADMPEIRRYVLSFYDKYLREQDIDLPAVRYFVMGSNEWKTADTWPVPGSFPQRWFLHSAGRANTSAGDGWLSLHEPGPEPADEFIYDPLHPVPTVGGRLLAMNGMVPGPKDQSRLETRGDVLCYTSHELKEDVEVTGPVTVKLYASTSAVDTDFTAKLTDVYPDGRSILVTEGVQRARYRKWGRPPEPVVPGAVEEYTIMLGNTSYLFRQGHRLRLSISSSNFPLYDRNMNTGRGVGEDERGVKAVQTIFHEHGMASYLEVYTVSKRE